MSEYYKVRFGTIYFTDDGTVTGRSCLVEVDGLGALAQAQEGVTAIAISGMPAELTRENELKGHVLSLKPVVIDSTVLANVIEALDDASADNTPAELEITDGPGAASVYVMPYRENGASPVSWKSFFNTSVYDTEIKLVTAGLLT
jgi:hypothetical protein